MISRPTGSGKTNLMINFLLAENILQYADVYNYSKTIHQRSYQYLKKRFNETEDNIIEVIGKDVK